MVLIERQQAIEYRIAITPLPNSQSNLNIIIGRSLSSRGDVQVVLVGPAALFPDGSFPATLSSLGAYSGSAMLGPQTVGLQDMSQIPLTEVSNNCVDSAAAPVQSPPSPMSLATETQAIERKYAGQGGPGERAYSILQKEIGQNTASTGVPFARLERMEKQLGIPLPAATQWELVEQAAAVLTPAFEHLLWQAAQGEVIHNDDTGMRILRLAGEPSDKRTGVFTSGIVSLWRDRKIALFFTGPQHAGENLADLLNRRTEPAAPIQMCDALSRNTPKSSNGVKILLANCIAHGRRQFIEVAANFPQECGYVLESLGMVYGNDALAREQNLDADARLRLHQQYSGPLMEQLHGWLKEQITEARTEPNSGLGKAISYLLKHWQALTLFLREKGAPLDNNLCERALKKAILIARTPCSLRRKTGLWWATCS